MRLASAKARVERVKDVQVRAAAAACGGARPDGSVREADERPEAVCTDSSSNSTAKLSPLVYERCN